MRALLVDDEKAARDRLRRLLEKHGVVIVGEASNGVEALERAAALAPEVIFLDIEMPALDGLSVARALPTPRPQIVFVTAYDKFALAAFETAAVDYLVKPVAEARLEATLKRLPKSLPALDKLPQSSRLAVKSGACFLVVNVADITSIIADDHYAIIRGGKKEVMCDEALGELVGRLDPHRFLRVHRSAIVNLDAVERMDREGDRKFALVLRDGQRILISRERLPDVKAALTHVRS